MAKLSQNSVLFLLLIFKCVSAEDPEYEVDFASIARANGYDCIEYKITTIDGYILSLNNIPGNSGNKPMFFIHGFVDGSPGFILRGNTSMAITQYNAGYDVWVGSLRGSLGSKQHVVLNSNPENDKYWDFSFHEMGIYDLPAQMDFILNTTSQKQLIVVSHSMGNTAFYALLTTRPEYNAKIRLMIGLAPLSFAQHIKPPSTLIIRLTPVLKVIVELLDQHELFDRIMRLFIQLVCSVPVFGNRFCEAVLLNVAGQSDDTTRGDFLPTILSYYPVSTSVKTGAHIAQLYNNKRLAQYDYGVENIMRYGSIVPPEYDLKKVNCSVAILIAKNDKLSVLEDNEMLRTALPNVVEYKLFEKYPMNHYDFLWGQDSQLILNSFILELLRRYQ